MELIVRQRPFETICCVCRRKKEKNGWRKGVVRPLADLSHGYCPECYRQTMLGHGLSPETGTSLQAK